MSSTSAYDVVVIGSDAAAATAAALLSADWNVALVQLPGQNDNALCWLSPQARPILDQLDISLDTSNLGVLEQCRFHNVSLSKSIVPNLPENSPGIVHESQLVRLLSDAMIARGGLQERCAGVEHLQVLEDGVRLSLSGPSRVIEARLAMVACSAEDPVLMELGLSTRPVPDAGLWCAAYSCPDDQTADGAELDFVLGLGANAGFAYRLAWRQHITVGIRISDSGRAAVAALIDVSRRLVDAKRLPARWQEYAAGTTAHWSPAGVALEIETHVAKRGLLVGAAGGFVASYTNESLYPGMWSAQLGTQIVHQALISSQPQDKLREFERLWRTTMADYLRMPNTDTESLLPLVFSNQQMADKMLCSLLLGANF